MHHEALLGRGSSRWFCGHRRLMVTELTARPCTNGSVRGLCSFSINGKGRFYFKNRKQKSRDYFLHRG